MKRRCPRLQPARNLAEGRSKRSGPEGSPGHHIRKALAVWCTALGVRTDGCWQHWGSIPPPSVFILAKLRAVPSFVAHC